MVEVIKVKVNGLKVVAIVDRVEDVELVNAPEQRD